MNTTELLVSVTMVAKVYITNNGLTARVEVKDPMLSPVVSFNKDATLDRETQQDMMKIAVTQLVKNVHENLQEEIKEIGEYAAPSNMQEKA